MTVFVNADVVGGSQNGTSWENAFPTIGQGIIAAQPTGDDVYIKGGGSLYTESNFLTLYNGVSLYGSFDPSLTGTSGDPNTDRDFDLWPSTFSGQYARAHFQISTSLNTIDGLRLVAGSSGTIGGSIWVNNATSLVLRNIEWNSCQSSSGGGAVAISSGTVTITDCEFINNTSSIDGGAINKSGGTLTLWDSYFENNGATVDGGAVYNSTGALQVENTTFYDNYCNGGDGGAVVCLNETSYFYRCKFLNNYTLGDDGGAVYDYGGTYIYCLFALNDAASSGGAFFQVPGGVDESLIVNCTFAANNCTNLGKALYLSGASVVSCNIWDNTNGAGADDIDGSATVTYTNVQDAYAGTGNKSLNPLFEGTGNDPYQIQKGSPCIDCADSGPANTAGLTSDILDRGWKDDPSAPNDGVGPVDYVDMGCYEFQPEPGTYGAMALWFNW